MNKRVIWALAAKDMRSIGANMQVWLPMAILPVFMGVLLPAGLIGTLTYFGLEQANLGEMAKLLENPAIAAMMAQLTGLPTLTHKVAYLFANYMLAPFFLLIPLMTASVIAADSFAGEKERSTLETLLFTPVDSLSLFTGKVLAAFLPSVGLSLGTFALTFLSVNAAGWNLFHRLFFPQLNWLPLMLLVIPAVSLGAVLLNVFVSARATSFQGAYQMGGMVVLPALALIVGQATGMLMLGSLTLVIIGVVLAVIDGIVLLQMVKRLDRSSLFESQIK